MGEAAVLGGCNCGAVRYRVTAEPLCSYLCHCHLCQKRTGGPFSMTLIYPQGAIELTAGEPEITERVLPDGRKNVAAICGACHSRLWTSREGWPTTNLRAGTLDDTSDIKPVAQFWTTSAQPWALVESILSYEEQPTDPNAMFKAWAERKRPG